MLLRALSTPTDSSATASSEPATCDHMMIHTKLRLQPVLYLTCIDSLRPHVLMNADDTNDGCIIFDKALHCTNSYKNQHKTGAVATMLRFDLTIEVETG